MWHSGVPAQSACPKSFNVPFYNKYRGTSLAGRRRHGGLYLGSLGSWQPGSLGTAEASA